MYIPRLLFLAFCVLFGAAKSRAEEPPFATDLVNAFYQARQGKPIRVVAIGGSITQAGKGWIEPWLRSRFPTSEVTVLNAGMSATGSDLAVFRIERDVIAAKPDLVLLEFAVNDEGHPRDDVIRTVESVLRRLKQQPSPPAVVFMETANRNRKIIPPQRAVAEHYGLLSIDLQAEVVRNLPAGNQEWGTLFSDDVHPNDAGHSFYSETIARALEPFAVRAETLTAPLSLPELPAPFSNESLLLGGRILSLPIPAGWTHESSLPFWWNQFFPDIVAGNEPGLAMEVPFRGTAIGLFYALHPDYGSFYASVDGEAPRVIPCNTRDGYTYVILAQDLAPCAHVLRVALPNEMTQSPGAATHGIKLGFALVAGETGASTELAAQGPYGVNQLRALHFLRFPANDWVWIGPFGDLEESCLQSEPKGLPDLHETYWPEDGNPETGTWTHLNETNDWIDFGRLTKHSDRGVSYARIAIQSTHGREVLARVTLDYFARIWVNGELAKTIDWGHGNVQDPLLFPLQLRQGRNEILIKVHSGSAGNGFSFALQDDGGQLNVCP